MATDKQVEYVLSLQEQCNSTEYSKTEVRKMNNEEVSDIIEEFKTDMAIDELYNECMSYGLPNQ